MIIYKTLRTLEFFSHAFVLLPHNFHSLKDHQPLSHSSYLNKTMKHSLIEGICDLEPKNVHMIPELDLEICIFHHIGALIDQIHKKVMKKVDG